MPEEVRGLNVKFDADFSEFKKNLKDADKDISSTQRQLKTLQQSLKIEWDPKKFELAQSKAKEALEATEKKAQLLRQRLEEIEKAGVTDKTRDEYNWLQEQILKTEDNAEKLEKQLEELDEIRLKNLTKGLDEAADKLDKASQKVRGLSTVAAAGVAALGALGLSTVEQADEIATLATKYDMSTDAIQRFNYVALQTDTEAEQLYKAFVKVQGGVADLQTGVESVSTKALSQLDLSFDKFSGKEEQFYAIVDALANMEDQARMVSIANDIFGEKMATNLFPLIYSGTDAINEYRSEFEKMGALTEDQITELAEFDNVLNDLKTQYKNVAFQLGSSLLPVMESFSSILTDKILPAIQGVVEWFGNLEQWQQTLVVSLLLIVAVLSTLLRIFSNVIGVVSVIVRWLKTLDGAVLASYGKWMLLGAAIATLFAVIANWSKMNTVQRVVGLLGALSAAALAAAVAFGVFHSAWSIGIAVAGIVAGIAAAVAAVKSAGKDIGSKVSLDNSSYGSSSVNIPEYKIPQTGSYNSSVTNNESTYVDQSNVVVNIEKNEYMSEDDIITAVNKGLKKAKQART